MTTGGLVESRLFRLCILLKVIFWAALLAILGKVLWVTATGGALPDPVLLATIMAAIVGLQVGAGAAWWRVRSARRKGTR